MLPFEQSQWIWADVAASPDLYTEFIDSLPGSCKTAQIRLSVDSDYALFVNGVYVASGQYGDFEHYKIYDTVDLMPYLTKPVNSLRILVYYCGVDTQRYRTAPAGLLYEVVCDGKIVAASSPSTLSRKHPAYISGQMRFVSGQLGFSFSYDATREGEGGFAPSVEVSKTVSLFPRPIPKQAVLEPCPIRAITRTAVGTYLVDLGEEVVGFCRLDLISSQEQLLTVAWGESLDDGRVRAQIHGRNFYIEYKAKEGRNQFTDYLLRIAGRYLEIRAEAPIEIGYAGIIPQVHQVEEVPTVIEDASDKEIYRISLRTLRLCMMEHYVDTPWREQCLYAFDSRNQMLCGYYAFREGNRDYARSNLVLLSEDRRPDGLLSICAPCGSTLAIPSFSLYYILAMGEYAHYTHDLSLILKYAPKMEGILEEFLARRSEDGLICSFAESDYWNFYDWSPYLEGVIGAKEVARPDLVINCLFVLALNSLEKMYQAVARPFPYAGIADCLRNAIGNAFATDGSLLSLHRESREVNALGNALAILCGAVDGEQAKEICRLLTEGVAIPSSLSMNVWIYDALLKIDPVGYRDYVLGQLRSHYSQMLSAGSTTVWETLEGSVAFGNAGSLCHGWSAVPVYLFHRLGIARPEAALR